MLYTMAGITKYLMMKDTVLIVSKMEYVILKMNNHILNIFKHHDTLRNLHISNFTKNNLLQSFINIMTTNNFDVIFNSCLYLHKENKI